MITFRRAVPGDVDGIIGLIRERILWMDRVGLEQWNKTDYFGRYPRTYFETNLPYFVVAEEDGQLLGTMTAYLEDVRWPIQRRSYYIHHLAVSPKAPGLGKRLLAYAEYMALRDGMESVRLDSAIDNKKLTAYYEALGYPPCGTCRDRLYVGLLREKEVSFDFPETMVTERLRIRKLRAEDWQAVRDIALDAAQGPAAGLDRPMDLSEEASRLRVARWAQANLGEDHLFYGAELEGRIIGYAAFHRQEQGYETGYCFHSRFHGQGYAKECLEALLLIFGKRGPVTAGTALENEASVRLLEKLGFRLTGREDVSFYKDEGGRDIVFPGGIFTRNE